MGNQSCIPVKEGRGIRSKSKRHDSSRKQMSAEEELMHLQALSLAIHQHQISQRFERSISRRTGSISSRRKSLPDTTTNGKQGLDLFESLKTKKFILIHGEGFGAWCWYKTISLLEEVGLSAIALDLTGGGIDQTDPNTVSTLAEYSKPLIDYLGSLPDDEKVILVGHSCGGATLSYALECHPEKIFKAVYLCATMVSNGQRPFDVFAEELASAEIFMQESKHLTYSNGRDQTPTSFMLDKHQIKNLYFNQSPSKDVVLAMVSMRPMPLGPMMEKLSLTPEKYGTVQRHFVQTLEDQVLSPDLQEKLVRENPPRGVFKIKGSDHCPFFSKPQSLHKILLEIAQTP